MGLGEKKIKAQNGETKKNNGDAGFFVPQNDENSRDVGFPPQPE